MHASTHGEPKRELRPLTEEGAAAGPLRQHDEPADDARTEAEHRERADEEDEAAAEIHARTPARSRRRRSVG